MGHDHNECLNRLLDGLERVNSSLGWLTNGDPAPVSSLINPVEADLATTGGVQ
jgi:hypothetical protein